MKKCQHWVTYSLALLHVSACAPDAHAQSTGGTYAIDPVVVSNGGGALRGGTFRIRGTFAQAATATSIASHYRVYAGFWAPISDVIFASGFDK